MIMTVFVNEVCVRITEDGFQNNLLAKWGVDLVKMSLKSTSRSTSYGDPEFKDIAHLVRRLATI